MHNFIKVSSMMPKFRKKINVEFQENAWTDGRMEGGTAMGQIRKKKKKKTHKRIYCVLVFI